MEYQNIGTRFAALLLDYIIIGGYYFLSGLVVSQWMADESSFDIAKLIFLFILLFFLLFFVILLYFIVMEGIFGWTLGKKVFGLQVVRADGSPCGLTASLIRNLFRLVDWLPVCYLLGALLIWNSPLRQRLGDRLASTVVVKLVDAPEQVLENIDY